MSSRRSSSNALQVCRRTLASQRGPRCTDDGPGVLLRACFRHALVAWRGASAASTEAEEVCIYTGIAQRFPTLVLALIPYSLSAAFALLKTQSLVVQIHVTRPNPSPRPPRAAAYLPLACLPIFSTRIPVCNPSFVSRPARAPRLRFAPSLLACPPRHCPHRPSGLSMSTSPQRRLASRPIKCG